MRIKFHFNLILLVILPVANIYGQDDFLLFTGEQISAVRDSFRSNSPGLMDIKHDLVSIADRLLASGPWTITDIPGKAASGDPHDYYSESPYWWPNPADPDGPYIRKDGLRNPDRFMGHKNMMQEMAQSVFLLSMAGYFLDAPEYSRHAARILHVWFINDQTRMNPNLNHGQAITNKSTGRGVGIIDTHRLAKMLIGVELLAASGHWSVNEKQQLQKWFSEYLLWLQTSPNGRDEQAQGNNHSTWWAVQAACFGIFSGQTEFLDDLWTYTKKDLLESQIAANGSFPHEEARTRSLDYSYFNLNAFALLFRIASMQGVDLWQYRTSAGAGLESSLTYLSPYITDPGSWPGEQILPHSDEPPVAYLMAGLDLNRPDYINLFKNKISNSAGRTDAFYMLLHLVSLQL